MSEIKPALTAEDVDLLRDNAAMFRLLPDNLIFGDVTVPARRPGVANDLARRCDDLADRVEKCLPRPRNSARARAALRETLERQIRERGQCRAITRRGTRCQHPAETQSAWKPQGGEGLCNTHLYYLPHTQ